MSFWTPDNLQHLTAGRWLTPPAATTICRGLGTDSRTVQPGQVYLALRGEKFDGHDFLAQAAAQGATLLIVSDAKKAANFSSPILLVPDTLIALQQLAAAYREELRRQGARVIAVVGSNGKTTARNLIHTVLSAHFRGTQSPKSFNNHIGVPLTILNSGPVAHATAFDDFLVVEVGTNHPGEIANLAQIVQPDALVLTSIGHEHMEFFHTLEGVADEETTIFPFLAAAGLVVLPGDAPAWNLLEPHLQRLPAGIRLLRFGRAEHCDLRLGACQTNEQGMTFQVQQGKTHNAQCEIFLPLLGEHNALNALAALAIGHWMGLDPVAMAATLARAKPVGMRLEAQRVPAQAAAARQILLLNDAYNANPDSVAAALRTLAALPAVHDPSNQSAGRQSPAETLAPRRVVILGDMLELGDHAPDLHRLIGRRLAEMRAAVSLVVLIGKLSLYTAAALTKAGWPVARLHTFAQWSDDLPSKVAALLLPGDVVLLKASRGLGLERLVPEIEKYLLQYNSPGT